MMPPNDFWLKLHALSESYDSEGLTADERSENIVKQFRQMPLMAQRQVMADLLRVVTHCPDLYPLIVAAANESEQAAKTPRQSAG
jgi:hypothetical protein